MIRIDLQKIFSMVPREDELESLLGNLKKAEHYEIHITVKSDGEIEQFKEACATLEVKPLVVQLSNGAVPDDVMTSSSITCTPSELRDECVRILIGLEAMSWNTVRCKIECAPFHEKVANLVKSDILPFQYFESHIPVTMGPEQTEDDWRRLRTLAEQQRLHMSANAFKVQNDTRTIMLTCRSTLFTATTFAEYIDWMTWFIAGFYFTVEKPVVEFAIFDSNRAHDNQWIGIVPQSIMKS